MEEKIIAILKKTLGVEVIDANTTQKQCESWDSMNALNIAIELEEEFNVSFEPEEMAQLDSVKAICDIVSLKLGK